MESKAFNMDCMEGMKQYPDKYFDLAVVDPPYGDALANERGWNRFGGRFDKYKTAPLPRREQEPKRPVEQVSATTCTAVAAREREREKR